LIDWTAAAVFIFFFLLVTVLGFVAACWQAGDLSLLHEWGLGGRRFGTIITWFLIGGDFYTSSLRAPAMIAFVKDVMIYIVVIAAVAVIPLHLGGYGAVFHAAQQALNAKGGAAGLTLKPAQMLPFR
jgi:Na+/proline symporter